MSTAAALDLMKKEVEANLGHINDVGVQLFGEETPLIRQSTLSSYSFNHCELGFIKTVSWLYSLYFETGKVNIQYLLKRMSSGGFPGGISQLLNHKDQIHALRTKFQHDLFEASENNRKITQQCQYFFQEACGAQIPKTAKDWETCLRLLLQDSQTFFLSVSTYIDGILQEEPEFFQITVSDWKSVLNRRFELYQIDRMIEEVMEVVGKEDIDVIRFRNRNLQKWQTDLDNSDQFSLRESLWKMIESDLINGFESLCPVDGRIIMEYFGIEPGPKVGELIQLAQGKYREYPCGKDRLLLLIREEVENRQLLDRTSKVE